PDWVKILVANLWQVLCKSRYITVLKGLKILVSVVQIRPRAPFKINNLADFSVGNHSKLPFLPQLADPL
ncbi:MAG: hypothetical protein RIC85_04410, partial [Gammaproteobacteria bacterium]